jgi:hypothetical protein
MAYSLGGGSFLNALVGQMANVSNQRQGQQDQLMKLMEKGFVPTDAAKQQRQQEGLLSQLFAAPQATTPGDFEMAPWNPAEVARIEREERGRLQKEQHRHALDLSLAEHDMETQRQEAQSQYQTERDLRRQEFEALMSRVNQDREDERQKSSDAEALNRIDRQADAQRTLLESEYLYKEAVATIEASKKDLVSPQDLVDLMDSYMGLLDKRKGLDSFWASDSDKNTVLQIDRILDLIRETITKGTSGGGAAAAQAIRDALDDRVENAQQERRPKGRVR